MLLKVDKRNDGLRLDVFLSNHLKDRTRSQIQLIIRKGNVFINNLKNKKCGASLKTGDIVTVKEYQQLDLNIGTKPQKIDNIKILYEGLELLVIDKPAGISVHPSGRDQDGTLLNGLIYMYKRLKVLGEKMRFGLVNRIDKETSGIVLVASSEKALWYYSRQFEEREVKKYYIAVVGGDIGHLFGHGEELLISNYIGRHPKNRKKMSVVEKTKGRLAATEFSLIGTYSVKKFGKYSIVLARPITGRTHQIRVHLKEKGFPIIGDSKYGGLQYKRMLLHSYAIRIRMLDNQQKTFKTDIPTEFDELLKHKNIPAVITDKIR
ncbi:MAG: RluA family pseudouridine synthase [Candidatus Dojkabacteria bacterium]|jgi:23S rRNA pseudouridine1911/1915/1917 synthase|nr:RluA family pseudouridine synthase [Candidatus Dojkabacteria bacterium]